MTKTIVWIDDGQIRWAADRARLDAALESLGWVRQNGWTITEPEAEEDDDPTAAYQALCQEVPEESGAVEKDDDDTMTFAPERGPRCWSY